MLASAACFTLMGALTHAAGERCDWRFVALARSVLALLFAAALVVQARVPFVVWRPGSLWLRSLCGSLSIVGSFYALTHLPIASALTLTHMSPIFIALFSWPMLGQVPTPPVLLAVIAGVAGVYLIQQPTEALSAQVAVFVAAGCSVTSALAMMGLHRLQHIDARSIVAHFSAVSTLAVAISLLPSFVTGWPAFTPGLFTVALLLGVGLSATAGQLTMTRAYAAGMPARLSVVGLSQVVFAMILDVLIWHRRFDAATLIGAALVIGPTAWLVLSRSAGSLDRPDESVVGGVEAARKDTGHLTPTAPGGSPDQRGENGRRR